MSTRFASCKKQQESGIRDLVLSELGKLRNQEATFTQLLEECRKKHPTLSKVTLTRHLKVLLKTKDIEKVYNSEHMRGYYRIKEKGLAKLTVESMIQSLGQTATHYIIRNKLKRPLEVDIFKEIQRYLETEPKGVSWEELFEYLEEKHPLVL